MSFLAFAASQTNPTRPPGTRSAGEPLLPAAAAVHPQSEHFVTADLYGDDRLDVVTSSGGQAAVHLGQGDGTFARWKGFGQTVLTEELADLDGDGDPDGIGYRPSGSGLTPAIFLHENDGHGNFLGRGSTGPLQAQFEDLLPADLDGDGRADFVVSNEVDSKLHWRRGNGNFLFEPRDPLIAFAPGTRLAAADVDGDQRLDVVTYRGTAQGGVGLHFGMPGGPSASSTEIDTSTAVTSLRAADLDGDVLTDLVYTCAAGADTLVRLAVGRRTGPPLPQEILTASGGLILGDAVDLDRDGSFDLVLLEPSSGDFLVFRGLAPGGFGPPIRHASGNRVTRSGSDDHLAELRVRDVDGDGVLDVITLQYTNSSATLLVHRGRGDGTFAAFERVSTGTQFSTVALDAADVDNDGVQDVAAAFNLAGGFGLYRGAGDGTFSTLSTYRPGGFVGDVRLADLDGNGWLDVVAPQVLAEGALVVVSDVGSSTPGEPVVRPGAIENDRVVVADFDRDGDLDLLTAKGGPGIIGNRVLGLLRGDGVGGFEDVELTDHGSNGPYNHLEIADLDGDGWMDAVGYQDIASHAYVHLNDQWGGFDSRSQFVSDGQGIHLADLDGDGAVDIAVTSRMPGRLTSVLWGVGDGTFPFPQRYSGEGRGLTSGDLDGDGRPELIVAGGAPHILTVLHQRRPRVFPAYAVYGSGSVPRRPIVADVDGDGLGDVLADSSDGAAFTVHRNLHGFPSFRSRATTSPGASVSRPWLRGHGLAEPGQRLALEIGRGPAGAPAWLMVRPRHGGMSVVPGLANPWRLSVVLDGAGHASMELELPPSEALVAGGLSLRAWIADAHAPLGLALTNRLDVLVRKP